MACGVGLRLGLRLGLRGGGDFQSHSERVWRLHQSAEQHAPGEFSLHISSRPQHNLEESLNHQLILFPEIKCDTAYQHAIYWRCALCVTCSAPFTIARVFLIFSRIHMATQGATPPPPGVVLNYNLNAGVHLWTKITTVLWMSIVTAFVAMRMYVKIYLLHEFHVEDCECVLSTALTGCFANQCNTAV